MLLLVSFPLPAFLTSEVAIVSSRKGPLFHSKQLARQKRKNPAEQGCFGQHQARNG